MPVELKNRPDEDAGDNGIYPDWYNPESDPLEEQFNAPSATDDDLPENHPSRSKKPTTPTSEGIKAAEESGDTSSTTKADQAESDQIGGGFVNESDDADGGPRKVVKSIFGRKKSVIGGGVAVAAVTGAFATFSFLQGPLQFIHMSQLFQKFHMFASEEMPDNRVGKIVRFYRTRHLPRQDRRIGKVSRKITEGYEAKLEKSGLKLDFDETTGRFKGITVLDANKGGYEKLLQQGHKVSGIDAKTGNAYFEDTGKFVGKNGRLRSLIGGATNAGGYGRISGALHSNVQVRRGGVSFKVLGNIRRFAEDEELKFKQKVRDQFREYVRKGDIPDGAKVRADSGENDPVDDNNNPKPDEDTRTAVGDLDDAGQAGAGKVGRAKISSIRESLRNKVDKSGKVLLAVAMLCVAKGIADSFDDDLYNNIIMPMMRMGSFAITTGAQAQTGLGGINMLELGVQAEHLYDEEDQTSWVAAKSVQAELGQPQTGPDIPEYARPNQKQNVILAFIASIGGLGTICSITGNSIVNFGIDLISASTGIGFITGQVFGEIFSRTVLGPLIDMVAGWFALENVPSDVAGAAFGNIGNFGTKLLAKDHNMSMGGVELTKEQSAAWKRFRIMDEQAKFAGLSLKDKLFSLNTPDSLAGKLLETNVASSTPQTALKSLALTPFTAPIAAITQSTGLLSQRAYAAEEYDYGFNDSGFTVEQMEDEKYADPIANEDRLQEIFKARVAQEQACHAARSECPQPYSSLEEMNTGQELTDGHGGPTQKASGQSCFSVTILANGTIVHGDSVNFTKEDFPEECKSEEESWMRYRFNILDLSAEDGAGCYEGDEESCGDMGINEAPPTEDDGEEAKEIAGKVGESSESIQCPSGTKDLGVANSRYRGALTPTPGNLRIRLCQIPDIPGKGNNPQGANVFGGVVVNSRVAANWLALAKQAKQDGVQLRANSSFRLADSCGGKGTGDACARPGNSPHQLGVAIDFSNMGKKSGSTTSCAGNNRARLPNNKGWKWMFENAEKFGLKQYTHEAWHWDPLPLANRCGYDG